jgi:hypothetical protein
MATKRPKLKLQVVEGRYVPPPDSREDTTTILPLDEYDYIIVSFSGGKDSIASYLHLLDLGVDPSRIELWHQAVDGEPGVDERFFDWPCTESYCKAFGRAFGSRVLFQWKEGGFRGEMLRDQAPTRPTSFELPNGQTMQAKIGREALGTRMRFPQVSADLRVRWCSAYLKIDVASKVFTNDPRFDGAKAVMLTGERRGESGGRARYAEADRHKASGGKGRRIDQWRAVINWPEEAVWEIMERYRVRPHPAYHLGWSRVSCFPCIFGNPDQWASVRDVDPALFERIMNYEAEFGSTLRRDGNIEVAANKGTSYLADEPRRNGTQLDFDFDVAPINEHLRDAMTENYRRSIIISPLEEWKLPRGAYGHSGGPV